MVPVANWCTYIRPCVLVEIGILEGERVLGVYVKCELMEAIVRVCSRHPL